MIVEWRPVTGFEGLYDVSSDGQVRGVKRRGCPGRVLRPSVKNTYKYVNLHKNDKPSHKYVHRLVAEAFHGSPKPGQEVRHLDGNPLNNSADNLRWGTSSENRYDQVRHGTHRWTKLRVV